MWEVGAACEPLGSSGLRDLISRQLLAGIARSQVRWAVSTVHHGVLRPPNDPEIFYRFDMNTFCKPSV